MYMNKDTDTTLVAGTRDIKPAVMTSAHSCLFVLFPSQADCEHRCLSRAEPWNEPVEQLNPIIPRVLKQFLRRMTMDRVQ